MKKTNLNINELDKIQINFIRKIVTENKFSDLKENKTLLFLLKSKLFGNVNNGLYYFNEAEINELIKISKMDIKSKRADALLSNINEKSGRFKRVHCDEIMIRTSNSKLMINQKQFDILSLGSFVIDYNYIKSVEHKYIIVVENYETFLDFNNYNDDCLIIYRGDSKYNTKNVIDFINFIKKPILLFIDFDISGLTNVFNSFKFNLEYGLDIFIPTHKYNIETLFENHGRNDLYFNQIKYSPLFHNLVFETEKINYIANLIKKNKSCLSQEIFNK